MNNALNIFIFFFIFELLFVPRVEQKTFAQENTSSLVPGLFESLKETIAKNDLNSEELFKNPSIKGVEKLQELSSKGIKFYLDRKALQTILFYLPQNNLYSLEKNPCNIAHLIWLDEIKINGKSPTSYPLIYSYKEATLKKIRVTRETYFKYLATYECTNAQEIAYRFTGKNLENTLKNAEISPPKDFDQCKKQRLEKLTNEEYIYYCYVINETKKGNKSLKALQILRNLTPMEQDELKLNATKALKTKEWLGEKKIALLEHFCTKVSNEKEYCDYYFSQNFWIQSLANGQSEKIFQPFCESNATLNKLSLADCLKKLSKSPDLCYNIMSNYPSLFPKPGCDESSQALNVGRLKFQYRDCPAKINNPFISNYGRILLHFNYDKILNSKLNIPYYSDWQATSEEDCSSNVVLSFIDFAQKIKKPEYWGKEICLNLLPNTKSLCAPFLFSNSKNNPYSFTETISIMLRRKLNMDKGQTCKIVKSNKFNSNLLEFRAGCWIVYESEKCNFQQCPMKIFLDDRELRDKFLINGENQFLYQAIDNKSTYNNGQFDLEKMLQVKSQKVSSLSELKFFFSQHDQGIIHGVACGEDLYPHNYKKFNFSQCSPLPFIIDGVLEKTINGKAQAALLSFRSGIDEIGSPRLLSWQSVLLGLESYQRFHPQNFWSLYGLYKN